MSLVSPISAARSSLRPESLRIAEIYAAPQGEGLYAGVESVFVRTTGCNLRCWFCDTPHTSWTPEGNVVGLGEILRQVEDLGCDHVVVTGGEPLTQPAVVPLTMQLKALGRFVTIETAGTLFRPVTADLISLSPKLSNSTPGEAPWNARHDQLRHNPDAICRFREGFACQWKFVVDRPEDLAEIDAYVAELELPSEEIWLMPQARSPEEVRDKSGWLAEEATRRGWRVSPRLHIEKHGNVRGT